MQILLKKISTVEKLQKFLSKKYKKCIIFTIWHRIKKQLDLDHLEVDKNLRRKGYGTKFMLDICAYADYYKLSVELTPSPLGKETNKNRLVKFYRRFGFRFKKNSDYCMLRTPKTNKNEFLLTTMK